MGGGPGPGGPVDREAFIKRMAERRFQTFDENKDGKVTLEEYQAVLKKEFDRLDSDGDGVLTAREMAAGGSGGTGPCGCNGGRFSTALRPSPQMVPKKLMTTVATTSSTAMVEITAPYCRNIGIGV